MNKVIFSVILITLLAACQPKPGQIMTPVAETLAAIPTQTAYPTYTIPPTQTSRVITKVVTITFTPTPRSTPTITLTPTKTPIPSPTLSRLEMPHYPGIYLVGIDIAPGLWRNNSSSDFCYWEITTRTGDILDNHFGQGGGTMYISGSAFQVTMERECGTWIYLGK